MGEPVIVHQKHKIKKKNVRTPQDRIRYGPDGGFDTFGMGKANQKKKRRKTRSRSRRRKTKKSKNLNDDSLDDKTDENAMSISKSQKSVSQWWHKEKDIEISEKDRKQQKLKRDRREIAERDADKLRPENAMHNWFKEEEKELSEMDRKRRKIALDKLEKAEKKAQESRPEGVVQRWWE